MTHRTSLFRYISEMAHFTSDTDCGRPSGRQRQPTHISVTSLYDLSDIRDLVRTSRHNSQVRRRKGNPMNKHPTGAKHRTVPTAPPYCTAAALQLRPQLDTTVLLVPRHYAVIPVGHASLVAIT